jgi:hypothetical protein
LTPGGAPISIRTTEYDIERFGVVFDTNLTLGAHAISTGFWAETNDFTQGRRFYGLPLNAERVRLERASQEVPDVLDLPAAPVVPFHAGERLAWRFGGVV